MCHNKFGNITEKLLSDDQWVSEVYSVLTEDSVFNFFFGVTIPAAIKRNENIGHLLINCQHEDIEKIILSSLTRKVAPRQVRNIDLAVRPDPAIEFVSTIINCKPNDVFVMPSTLNLEGKDWKYIWELAKQLLEDSKVEIQVGKDNPVLFDAPPFTLVFCTCNKVNLPFEIIPCFENVLDINLSRDQIQRMCVFTIKKVAQYFQIKFTDGAVEQCAGAVGFNLRQIYNFIKRINDFTIADKVEGKQIDEEYAGELLIRIV